MKSVLICGSSGMIGGLVLKQCLASAEIDKVTSIVRRASGLNDPKLNEVIHDNFLDYSAIDSHFSDQDIIFYCIGVYTGQVRDEQFKKITVDFTKAFADTLKQQSPQATFCFLSGSGADQSVKSRISFARYKGMAENYLIEREFPQLFIFRPAYIYPVEKRKEPNLSYTVFRYLYSLFKLLGKKYSVKSTELAKAMFIAGTKGAEQTILENEDILHLVED